MTKDKFIEELLEALELEDSITEDSKLKDIDGYDSLSVLSLIAFIHKKFGVSFAAKKLNDIDTIGNLMELIGKEHFEV